MKWLLLLLLPMQVFGQRGEIINDTAEARKAFIYLNKIRQAPGKYSEEIGVNLGEIQARPILIWNDTLAKVAAARAEDLAKRKYFAHVNPDGVGCNYLIGKAGYKIPDFALKNKKSNFYESLQAGAFDSEEAIRYLIVDEGVSGAGHRKHLLGLDYYSQYTDAGIAFIRSKDAPYSTYSVIIIAAHNW